VTAFRQLAINSSQSISKGERIVLTGRLRVRDWDNGERSGTSVEIEADAIGHDQSWGTSQFVRTVLQKESEAETEAIEEVEASAQVSSDTPDAPESRRRAVPQPA
jgi:single-strand DNA-binding protein